MTGYIRVYYAFAICLLLCALAAGILLAYNIIWTNAAHDKAGLIATLVSYTGVACMLLKSVVSIKACRRYNQSAQLTSPQRDVFMAAWWFAVFFGAGTLLESLSKIPRYVSGHYNGYSDQLERMLMDGYVLLLAIACIYFVITDRILLKAINKKHEESLLRFDVQEA